MFILLLFIFLDQEFKGRNASLVVSCTNKYPVRVIRGHSSPSPYAPVNGYRYFFPFLCHPAFSFSLPLSLSLPPLSPDRLLSCTNKYPVRVIRGHSSPSPDAGEWL